MPIHIHMDTTHTATVNDGSLYTIDVTMTSCLQIGGSTLDLPDVIPRDVTGRPTKVKLRRKLKKSRSRSENLEVADDDTESVTSVDSLGSDHSRKKNTKKSHRKTKRSSCPVHGSETDVHVINDDKKHLPHVKCSCKRRNKRTLCKRPDPEGGSLTHLQQAAQIEYERVLGDNGPLFSDIEDDDIVEKQIIQQQSERLHRRWMQQEKDDNMFAGAQLVNTNSSLKFAIIATELQNIIVVLKRVCECDISN